MVVETDETVLDRIVALAIVQYQPKNLGTFYGIRHEGEKIKDRLWGLTEWVLKKHLMQEATPQEQAPVEAPDDPCWGCRHRRRFHTANGCGERHCRCKGFENL